LTICVIINVELELSGLKLVTGWERWIIATSITASQYEEVAFQISVWPLKDSAISFLGRV